MKAILHCLFVAALSVTAAFPGRAWAEDLRLYLVGNSLTDAVRAGDLAGVAAFADKRLIYGQHLIWGASLDWLWANPEQSSKLSPVDQNWRPTVGMWKDALPGRTWDAVSLQPFGRPLVGEVGGKPAGDVLHALRFIDHALQNPENRATRFLIYQHSPSKPSDGRDVAFEAWWTDRPYTGKWDQSEDTSAYAYLLRDAVQAELDSRLEAQRPAHPVAVVPVGDVFLALDRVMHNGELHGYPAGSSAWDLYSDHVHFNATGQYAAAMAYYAVLFGESPVGLPVGRFEIAEERAARVQRIVWDVVQAAAER